MHKSTLATFATLILLAGCAATSAPVAANRDVSFDDAPTGTLIKRRPQKDANGNVVKVDRNLANDPSVIGTFDTKQQ